MALLQGQDAGTTAGQTACSSGQPDVPAASTLSNLGSAEFNAQILEQHNKLLTEEAAKQAYVGDMEDLASLKQEYVNGSGVFQRKIDRIQQVYSHIRRTRGDGNCFFRAFIFAYLEHLVVSLDSQECNRFSTAIQGWRALLIDTGFQELVFEDALSLLLQHVDGISQGLLGLEALEAAYRDDTASNLIIMLMRFITSAEIQRREDFFLPFILGMYDDPPDSVELFCQRFVEPMSEESDNIHIVALTDALQVPVRVVHLDQSSVGGGTWGAAGDVDVNIHDFVPDACAAAGRHHLPVHVLYRPGHYDILYPRHESA